MPHNAPVDKIDRLVGSIMMDNYISFSDDEISLNGRGNTKALHITTKVKDCILPKVLIDNESSLNVMPLSTLMRLPMDRSYSGEGFRWHKARGDRRNQDRSPDRSLYIQC